MKIEFRYLHKLIEVKRQNNAFLTLTNFGLVSYKIFLPEKQSWHGQIFTSPTILYSQTTIPSISYLISQQFQVKFKLVARKRVKLLHKKVQAPSNIMNVKLGIPDHA